MARLTVLDASILLAHFDGSDPHNRDAGRILSGDDDFVISTLALAETLVSATRAGVADEVLDTCRELEIEEVAPGAGAALALARLRVETGLKLPDCCVLHVAEVTDATAIATRDARLATVAAQRGLQAL